MKKIIKVLSIMLVLSMIATLSFTLFACSPKKYNVGVQAATTGGDYVGEFENLKAVEYSNGALAVTDLKNGKVNAVIIDAAPAATIVKNIAGVKLIDIELTEEEYAFGVNKDDAALLAQVNLFLVEKAAEIEAIKVKYFDGSAELVGFTNTAKENLTDKLVVATNAEFAPFEYHDGDKYFGIDMEIAVLLAEYLGKELYIDNMEFEAVVMSVGKNNVDIAMAGLTVTETRKESVSFTASYFNAAQKIIVLESDTTFDDCKTAEDVEAILNQLKG